jgi:hypothetical protein
MKNILIPLDFEFSNESAMDYAITLFEQEECHFYFSNSYTYNIEGLNALDLLQADDDWFEKPKYNSEMNLKAIFKKYRGESNLKNHHFNTISKNTYLIEGLRKTIENLDIDLVVLLGKDQSKGNSDHTKRIVQNITECPVMIIPTSAHLQKPQKFVLASSFEVELLKSKLKNCYAWANTAGRSIKIVSLFSKDKMTQTQKVNQNKVYSQIQTFTKYPVSIQYSGASSSLKSFIKSHSDYIITIAERKSNFWTKYGLTQSWMKSLRHQSSLTSRT